MFFDVAVKGVTYSASPSGLGGTTDASGTFLFMPGDTVTFTLNVGNGVLQLGSIVMSSAPSGGSANAFVLSLTNGLAIAQVLQSLNHGSPSAMDVSGLTLAASDVTALTNYIASGGQTLPPTDSTDLQMLAQAQTDSNLLAASFVDKGGASIDQTLAALDQALATLPPASGDLSSKIPGQLVFSQFFVGAGAAGTDSSISFLGTNGEIVSVDPAHTTNPKTQPYSISGNVLTITSGSGTTISYTVSYFDSREALWTASNATASAPGYSLLLQQSLTPNAIAGKAVLLAGEIERDCAGVPLQILVDTTGANYSIACSGAVTNPAPGAQLTGGTIAAVASMPGVVSLTDASGAVFYLALLKNGSLQAGNLAINETNVPAGATPFEGIYQVNLP